MSQLRKFSPDILLQSHEKLQARYIGETRRVSGRGWFFILSAGLG
jgi:hypothetical protein